MVFRGVLYESIPVCEEAVGCVVSCDDRQNEQQRFCDGRSVVGGEEEKK